MIIDIILVFFFLFSFPSVWKWTSADERVIARDVVAIDAAGKKNTKHSLIFFFRQLVFFFSYLSLHSILRSRLTQLTEQKYSFDSVNSK